MTISSMTGFGRSDGSDGVYTWNWEIKSVNGKGLDARCRLPGGLDHLEPEIRARLGTYFSRGNFQIGLYLNRTERASQLAVNETALNQILDAVKALSTKVETAPPSPDGLLGLRGVLEMVELEESDEEKAARDAVILESLDEALKSLQEARLAEGAELNTVLKAAVGEIEALAVKAKDNAAVQPEAIAARLKKQVEEILEGGVNLDKERLTQEVAVLLVKGDIREEIDRLNAHAAAARDLLGKEEPVGRRLDFLMQEFNREANTLCSKATDVELTRIGLDLKAVIDQAREQVQNIE